MVLNDIEQKLLAEIQHGIPVSPTPYVDIAAKISVDTDQVLEILNKWKQDGRLRRIGAIVNHFKVGFQAGAMVVWQVEQDRIEEVGNQLASFPQVSHAYKRPSSQQWPYDIYTMVHGHDDQQLKQTITEMSEKVGINSYKQLETVKELKKVPPTYIIDK